MRAATLEAAIAAVRRFPGPGQNWVAASRDGGIAHAVVGLVPNRVGDGWDGRNVTPWTGPFAWDGFVPAEQLPLARDPARGFVLSANDPGIAARPPGPDQRTLTGDFEAPWRAARLDERLSELGRATLEDMAALQDDARSGSALELQQLVRGCGLRGAAAELYLGWDGTLRGGGAPLLHESLRAALAQRMRVKTRLGLSGAGPYLRGTWTTINLLRASSESPWIEHQLDDPRTAWPEDACALLRTALEDAWGAANRHAGASPAAWTWERWHVIAPASPVGIGPLASWFNPPAEGMAGSFDTPCAAANPLPRDGFAGKVLEVTHSASYRLVARLGADGVVSRSALPGGQDEHPASPHAWDRLPGYAAGRVDPLVPPDTSPAAGTLRLVP
jgi:penicillin amidase